MNLNLRIIFLLSNLTRKRKYLKIIVGRVYAARFKMKKIIMRGGLEI